MTREEFEQSGILEAYAAGIATAEEIGIAENMLAQHPELVVAYQQIAAALEVALSDYQVSPPPQVEDQIVAQLFGQASQAKPSLTIDRSEEDTGAKVIALDPEEDIDPQSLIQTTRLRKQLAWMQYVAAAAVAIAFSSLVGNMFLYNQLQDTELALASVKDSRLALESSLQQTKMQLATTEDEIKILADPKTFKVTLNGMNEGAGQVASVVWNPSSKDLKLMMPDMGTLPDDKDLQLWALVDGKPVDLGLLPKEGGMITQPMAIDLAKADAFAVTIEAKGGRPTPEGSMVLMGQINS